MFYSRVTPSEVSAIKAPVLDILELDVLEQSIPYIEEKAETPKSIKPSFLVRVLSNKYVFRTAVAGALGAQAIGFAGNYLEANYGARHDWSESGSCTVHDKKTKQALTFATQNDDFAKGATILKTSWDVFAKCAEIARQPGFQFGGLGANYDLHIKSMKGFNGEYGSSIGGNGKHFDADQSEQAGSAMDEFSYLALKRHMQMVGEFNTMDWWRYQRWTTQRYMSQKTNQIWTVTTDTIKTAWADTVDGAISGLENLKPVSPSPQGSGSQTSSAPQAQSPR